MKTKDTVDSKFLPLEKLAAKKKSKSFRPMRSMVAVRSLKPRTGVAIVAKPELETRD